MLGTASCCQNPQVLVFVVVVVLILVKIPFGIIIYIIQRLTSDFSITKWKTSHLLQKKCSKNNEVSYFQNAFTAIIAFYSINALTKERRSISTL